MSDRSYGLIIVWVDGLSRPADDENGFVIADDPIIRFRSPGKLTPIECISKSDVVQAFRPAVSGGPEGPHDSYVSEMGAAN